MCVNTPELVELVKALSERLGSYAEWHRASVPESDRDDYEKEYLIEGAEALCGKADAIIAKIEAPKGCW